MIKAPKSLDEAVGLGGKLLWWAGRLRLIGIVVGIAGTIAVQLLAGFWVFRSEHQVIVREQYLETLAAHAVFQRQIERFNAVFEGKQKVEADVGSYSEAAQIYIREIKAASRLLPSTENEVADYVDAIANLRQYYMVDEPPEIGSLDWVIFYGQFRTDFDLFVRTRDAYLAELAGEVGSYWRSVLNS